MSASASKGGVRLLAACAAINMTLAAIGWFWQGGYVASPLLDKISRSGTLTLGSWNWNAVHVVLWALWLSGWFAFLAARFQVARLNGPNLHRLAMTIAAAGTAASLFWLGSLIDVARHLWALDGGRLLSGGVTASLVRWTAAPLAIGAAVAIFYFVVMMRWSSPETVEPAEGDAEKESSPEMADEESTEIDDLSRSKRRADSRSAEYGTVRTLQFGAAALSMAGFGLFWQFVAFGPAESTWSLDRLFSGPAATGWAALTFLALAHVAHIVSGALTVFDRPNLEPEVSGASGGRESPESFSLSDAESSDEEAPLP